jgi:hypothetical protein
MPVTTELPELPCVKLPISLSELRKLLYRTDEGNWFLVLVEVSMRVERGGKSIKREIRLKTERKDVFL